MILELTERLLTIFVAAAQKVFPLLKIEADPQHRGAIMLCLRRAAASMVLCVRENAYEVGQAQRWPTECWGIAWNVKGLGQSYK